jgi:hypothetical protein
MQEAELADDEGESGEDEDEDEEKEEPQKGAAASSKRKAGAPGPLPRSARHTRGRTLVSHRLQVAPRTAASSSPTTAGRGSLGFAAQARTWRA